MTSTQGLIPGRYDISSPASVLITRSVLMKFWRLSAHRLASLRLSNSPVCGARVSSSFEISHITSRKTVTLYLRPFLSSTLSTMYCLSASVMVVSWSKQSRLNLLCSVLGIKKLIRTCSWSPFVAGLPGLAFCEDRFARARTAGLTSFDAVLTGVAGLSSFVAESAGAAGVSSFGAPFFFHSASLSESSPISGL